MKTKFEHDLITEVKLRVTHPRARIGCDFCKEDNPTQRFIGYIGDVLWICRLCFKRLTKNATKII